MIDTPMFFFYIETMHDLLIFARFQSIFSITVWNTIDDRYSIFPLYRNEVYFLIKKRFYDRLSGHHLESHKAVPSINCYEML